MPRYQAADGGGAESADDQGYSSRVMLRWSKRVISAVAGRAERCTALFAGTGAAYAESAAPDPGSCQRISREQRWIRIFLCS
jgi:hypothetical protein